RPVTVLDPVGFAEHLDVAAKRNGGEAPARPMLVVPAEQLGPEADGKRLDSNARPPRHVVVAHFVDEDENRQNHQKWKNVIPERRQELHYINHTALFWLDECIPDRLQ